MKKKKRVKFHVNNLEFINVAQHMANTSEIISTRKLRKLIIRFFFCCFLFLYAVTCVCLGACLKKKNRKTSDLPIPRKSESSKDIMNGRRCFIYFENRNGWALVGERKRSDNYLAVSQ